MKSKPVMSILALVITLGLLTLIRPDSVSAKTIDLKFGHPYSAMHPQQVKAFEPWAKDLEKRSAGRLKVTFVPDGELGKPSQAYQAVELGIADIGWDVANYNADKFPLTSVFNIPFMVKSAEQGSIAMWRTYAKEAGMQKEYANLKLLSINCHSPGAFATVNQPIKSLADLRGLKIITATNLTTAALTSFGALPQTYPITQDYQLLKMGIVEGVVLPFDGIATFKLQEVLKYFTPAGFYIGGFWVAMNKAKFDGLPQDLKQIIDDISGEALSRQCGIVFDQGDVWGQKVSLEAGMQKIDMSDAELQKLKAVKKPMQEQWIKDMEAQGLPGKKVLATALAELTGLE